MNDFIKGVKARMKSRSAVYALLFLALMIGQQIYEGRNVEPEQNAPQASP